MRTVECDCDVAARRRLAQAARQRSAAAAICIVAAAAWRVAAAAPDDLPLVLKLHVAVFKVHGGGACCAAARRGRGGAEHGEWAGHACHPRAAGARGGAQAPGATYSGARVVLLCPAALYFGQKRRPLLNFNYVAPRSRLVGQPRGFERSPRQSLFQCVPRETAAGT